MPARWLLGFATLLWLFLAPAVFAIPGIEVKERTQGTKVTLTLLNPHFCELTVSVDLTLQNMKSVPPTPVRMVCPPKSTRTVVLDIADPNKEWKWSYKYHFQWGSPVKFDPGTLYQLPYRPGAAFSVIQGFDGKTSHSGDQRFAIDFGLPLATPVHAARSGKVVFIQDGFSDGKFNIAYKYKANFIYIRHADGTLAEYVHLTRNSMRVKLGDMVQAGQALGLSGNTGYSTGPHLHFMVFRARDSKNREPLPVRFLTAEGQGIVLEQGRNYTALRTKGGGTTK